jgi:hypothetical protein
MAHYRYCVHALHVFGISCPVLSKVFLYLHECSLVTLKIPRRSLVSPLINLRGSYGNVICFVTCFLDVKYCC